MIIGRRHRYLFVETPHAASTAIARELRELYAGEQILHKHASYGEFVRQATPEERTYLVFTVTRQPMDTTVSLYFRIATDHKSRYSSLRPGTRTSAHHKAEMEDFEWIHDREADFATWFLGNVWLPYDDWLATDARHFDAVIRFDHLQSDFAAVLGRLGIEQVRPLAQQNRTASRDRTFEQYYTPPTRARAAWVFGPYFERVGYEFPAAWGPVRVPPGARLLYRLLQPPRRYFRTHRFGLQGTVAGGLRNLLVRVIKRRQRPRVDERSRS